VKSYQANSGKPFLQFHFSIVLQLRHGRLSLHGALKKDSVCQGSNQLKRTNKKEPVALRGPWADLAHKSKGIMTVTVNTKVAEMGKNTFANIFAIDSTLATCMLHGKHATCRLGGTPWLLAGTSLLDVPNYLNLCFCSIP
jgi:hypothetical protein